MVASPAPPSPGQIATADAGALLQSLGSRSTGLTEREARQRLESYGPNRIEESRGPTLLKRLAEQFVHLFAILLWVGAGLALLAGLPQFAIAIVAVIVLNGLFGLFQERRAENAVAALKKLLPVEANVRREAVVRRVPAGDLVPGDLLVLNEGDRVSADARLLEATELALDESNLTGESRAVAKHAGALEAPPGSPIAAANVVFAGSMVTSGGGVAVVVATGMHSEFGRVAHLTQSLVEGQSPLQRQVVRVARRVAALSVAMGVVFFTIGYLFAGLSLQAGAIFAIGIVLGNVPEGLLPTLTLSLAMGVRRMAGRNAIVKRLSAVETLGSCTVICTDKTGTLTANQMTVRRLWMSGREITVTGEGYSPEGSLLDNGIAPDGLTTSRVQELLGIACLCSTARPHQEAGGEWRIAGDPTEGAIAVAAAKAGLSLEELESTHPLERRFAFDATRKRTSAVRRTGEGGNRLVAVKGAADQLLPLCSHVAVDRADEPMAAAVRAEVLRMNERLALQGLRVLGVARRSAPGSAALQGKSSKEVEADLVFLGLVAMEDPPRPEVPEAIARCRAAGIRVLMTTGDYGGTAEAIAREIGLLPGGPALIVTGKDLAVMDDPTLRETVRVQDPIFSRVAPEQKLRIVAALQDLGETVAVTGDGVNDAPALKRADIGVAMGVGGTDVAREASDMVLTDDNFATIVAAVEEGRAIFDNMRKFIVYIFAHLSPEAIPFVFFALFPIPLPLTVMQILAIDLGTETLPALALGSERAEPDVMSRPPRRRSESLLGWASLVRGYGFLGLLTTVVVMSAFFLFLHQSGWHWGERTAGSAVVGTQATTIVFLGIVLMQVGNAFACRTERASAFTIGFLSNRLLLWGIAFELALAAALIYVPLLQGLFDTAAIPPGWWVGLAAFIPVVFAAEELRKLITRRRQVARLTAQAG